MIVIRKLLYRR